MVAHGRVVPFLGPIWLQKSGDLCRNCQQLSYGRDHQFAPSPGGKKKVPIIVSVSADCNFYKTGYKDEESECDEILTGRPKTGKPITKNCVETVMCVKDPIR